MSSRCVVLEKRVIESVTFNPTVHGGVFLCLFPISLNSLYRFSDCMNKSISTMLSQEWGK